MATVPAGRAARAVRRLRPPRGRLLLVAVALFAVATALVAVNRNGAERAGDGASSAAASAGSYDAGGASFAASAAETAAAASSAAAEVAAAPAEAAVSMAASAAAPEVVGAGLAGRLAIGQRIAQTVELDVRVAKGGVPKAVQAAESYVAVAGGYVVSADVAGSPDRTPDRATLTVRVPQGRADKTLERLESLGSVTGQRVASEDRTQDFIDTTARMKHAREVEARLVDLLGKATTVTDILRVQDRLNGVQEQIEIDKGRLDGLRAITDDATITLSIVEPTVHLKPVAATVKGESWGVTRALHRSARAAIGVVNASIVVIGALAPFVVLALLVVLVWRLGEGLGRRRARRRAEDAAPPPAAAP